MCFCCALFVKAQVTPGLDSTQRCATCARTRLAVADGVEIDFRNLNAGACEWPLLRDARCCDLPALLAGGNGNALIDALMDVASSSVAQPGTDPKILKKVNKIK
jgi:hypothetical protein